MTDRPAAISSVGVSPRSARVASTTRTRLQVCRHGVGPAFRSAVVGRAYSSPAVATRVGGVCRHARVRAATGTALGLRRAATRQGTRGPRATATKGTVTRRTVVSRRTSIVREAASEDAQGCLSSSLAVTVPVPTCGDLKGKGGGSAPGSTSARRRKDPSVRHTASRVTATTSQATVACCAKAVGLATPSTAGVGGAGIKERRQERSLSAQRTALVAGVGRTIGTASGRRLAEGLQACSRGLASTRQLV